MQKSPNKYRIINVIASIAIISMLFGLWTQHNFGANRSPTVALNSATLLLQPRAIVPFKLVSDNNQAFTNDNFKNQWSLMFFGFTHCPRLCPTTLATLNQVYKNLQQNHVAQLPQIVFISVDPEQDTPQRIHSYLHSFNDHFVGATGSKQQIDDLTKELNVAYAKVFPNGTQAGYTIDHSGTLLLINPQGQLTAIFSTPHDAVNIAKDFMTIQSR